MNKEIFKSNFKVATFVIKKKRKEKKYNKKLKTVQWEWFENTKRVNRHLKVLLQKTYRKYHKTKHDNLFSF